MEQLINYIYKDWRVGESGYGMIALGAVIGLIFIISIIISIYKSGR